MRIAQPRGMRGSLEATVEAVLSRAVAARQIIGGVALICRSGRPAAQWIGGFADREARTPVRADTIFRWASLTKPVTAVVSLALVERNLIALDDPVTRYLPDFRPALADGTRPTITLRHLITHSAGLAYGFSEPRGDGPYQRAEVSDGLDQPGLSMDENLRRIVSVPLAGPPGSAWRYSVGTDVLGAALVCATGQELPDLVRELVTGPLGMADSGFVAADRGRLATAYSDGPREPVRMGAHHLTPYGSGALSFAPDRMFDAGSFPSGGVGMCGTASDFMRFLEVLRKGGTPVLLPGSVQQLTTITPDSLDLMRPGWKWPLGWAVLADPAPTNTPQRPGTWRWGGVYGNSWFVDPALDLSVVLITNTAVAGMTGALPDGLRNAIYTALAGASAR